MPDLELNASMVMNDLEDLQMDEPEN